MTRTLVGTPDPEDPSQRIIREAFRHAAPNGRLHATGNVIVSGDRMWTVTPSTATCTTLTTSLVPRSVA